MWYLNEGMTQPVSLRWYFPMDDRKQNQINTDVVEALLSLGYSERDTRTAVQKIPRKILGTNEHIKYALEEVG